MICFSVIFLEVQCSDELGIDARLSIIPPQASPKSLGSVLLSFMASHWQIFCINPTREFPAGNFRVPSGNKAMVLTKSQFIVYMNYLELLELNTCKLHQADNPEIRAAFDRWRSEQPESGSNIIDNSSY
jgi:hypothetical protein